MSDVEQHIHTGALIAYRLLGVADTSDLALTERLWLSPASREGQVDGPRVPVMNRSLCDIRPAIS
jgi:hypothetical protein